MQTIVLDATTKTLQAVMSGAAATTNPSVVAAWADDTGSAFTEGSSDTALNGTTPVTLVAAPGSSTRRVIKSLTIANIDTAPVTLTLSYNDNATLRTIVKVTLQVNDTWTTDGTYDTNGNLKQVNANTASSLAVGTTTITSGTTTRILYDNAGVLGEYTLTGSGTVVVMATSPTLTTPTIGVATATSINKMAITAPATSSTLAVADGKTFTSSNTMTLAAGADGQTFTFPAATATVAGLASTQTMSNKRITRRVVTTTQSATPTINTDNTDVASITALGQAITSMTTNLTGTPNAGDFLEIQITDNGTARAITWGTSFVASTVALPSTTVISTLLHVLFEWDATSSKWICVGTA